MKTIFTKYFRETIILIFGIIITVFLYKIYFTTYSNNELIKFKLETLDKEIDQLYEQRKSLDSSINVRNKNIEKIDSSLNNLKVERKTVNNIFQIKEVEIREADAKKTDSLLKLRFRY
jgi:chromosome segregation ATPase